MGPVVLKSYSNSLFFKQHSEKAIYDEFPLKLLMVMRLAPSRTPMGKGSYFTGAKCECDPLMKSICWALGYRSSKEADGHKSTEELGTQLFVHHFPKQKEQTLWDLKSLPGN